VLVQEDKPEHQETRREQAPTQPTLRRRGQRLQQREIDRFFVGHINRIWTRLPRVMPQSARKWYRLQTDGRLLQFVSSDRSSQSRVGGQSGRNSLEVLDLLLQRQQLALPLGLDLLESLAFDDSRRE
jgi:hypothetical protein